MSDPPFQPSQIANISNNSIIGDFTIAFTMNVGHDANPHSAGSAKRTNRESPPLVAATAQELEIAVKELKTWIDGAMDLPEVFSCLGEELDKLLRLTIPKVIELARGDVRGHIRLMKGLNCMLMLTQCFLEDIGKKELGLTSHVKGIKHGTTIIGFIWQYFWWKFYGNRVVRKFQKRLEDQRCSVEDILFETMKIGTQVPEQQIEVDDFFGARWFLPTFLCLNQATFNMALRSKFEGGSAAGIVEAGQFCVYGGSRLQIVRRSEWHRAFKTLQSIQLSVVLELTSEESSPDSTLARCPRCKYARRITSSNIRSNDLKWVDCDRCESESRFGLSDNEVKSLDAQKVGGAANKIPEYNSDLGSPFKYYTITSFAEESHAKNKMPKQFRGVLFIVLLSTMPSAFRLSFAQPRPGPSIKFLDKVSERSESTSSTEYEKVTPPLQTVFEPDEVLQPSSIVPAAISGEGTPLPLKPGEPEQKFALAEDNQCVGETRRMEAFNDFLKAATLTFQHNEQERAQKIQASLDSQKAEFTSHENDRQTLFSKDWDRFERIAKENQSQWDADRTFYETTRESLLKTGRERRTLLKDEAIRKLEKFAQEMCEVERKQFEKETQRMDGVVGELIQKAKLDIQTITLGTLKLESDSILVPTTKEEVSAYEYRDSIAPVITDVTAPANQGLSFEPDTSELSYFSPPPPPPKPIPLSLPPAPPYEQPVNPITSPTRGRPLPLPPGCRSPAVVDSFTSQLQPLISPASFNPKTSTNPLGMMTTTNPPATQPFIFQPSPRRLPEPQSPSESSSFEEVTDRPRTLPAIPNSGVPISPPKDSIGFAVDLAREDRRRAEGATSASCRQLGLEAVEVAREEDEAKRQAIFDSVMGTMRETFSLNLSGFSERFTFLEIRRGGGEHSRDQEFDSLLKLLRSRFESFKAGIEKRYGMLDVLDEAFNEELRAGIVQSSLKQEKELNDAREKIRASFAELQLVRTEQLRVVLDELNRVKNGSTRPALYIPTSSSHFPPSTNGRKEYSRSSDPVLWNAADEDVTWGYYGGLPTTGGAGLGAGTVFSPQGLLSAGYKQQMANSRSRTPPTGFAAQTLFKMQTFGSLPAPRPPIAELPSAASTPPTEQLPALASSVQKPDTVGVGEDVSKREVGSTINESRRAVAFDKAQAERQQVFDTTERERGLEVAKKIWEHDQKFMEAELQRSSSFLDKTQLRSDKFIQEQAKMREEYYETEGRLVRSCMMQVKARDEAIRETAKGKIEWWGEDVKREETERKWEFEEMVKWFEERGGYQT